MFANVFYFYWLIPIFIILILFLKKDWVKLDYDLKTNKSFMKRRKLLKVFLFLTRFTIIALFIALLARPYIELQTTEQGIPQVTILVDNSSSMQLYDTSFVNDIAKRIGNKLPVRIRSIANDPLYSNIGDELISYMEHDGSILLVSDMQSTHGVSIEDAIRHSSILNASISAINLKTNKKDIAVTIDGPDKATRNQEISFDININKLNIDSYNLLITVDDKPVKNIRDTKDLIKYSQKFNVGEHIISAKILSDDYNTDNNIYYKTITIVPQPKLLYVTRTNSKLPELLSKYYNIVRENQIPKDLSPYYVIILEDMNTRQIGNVETLADFVSEGNGLFVIGGMNSYDRGGYKSSSFETLLPVKIGSGEKKQGDSNIVLLIDMSGSTSNYWAKDVNGNLIEVKDNNPLDVIKALAVDVIETLNRGNKLGVVAFAIPDPNDPFGNLKAVKVTDIEPLGNIKEEAIDKISRINVQGQSLFDIGMSGAYEMLRHEGGNRNIILISDGGKNIYKTVKDNARNIATKLSKEGIKTYTVGVGRNVDDVYLESVAKAGNGIYFPAGQENRLKILFGTPEEKKQGDEMNLFILNPVHFITKGLQPNAKIYGFNQVVPKSLARTIITTDSGEPALSEWRYGIGKVLSLTVFSGSSGLGQLLSGNNSKILTRSINYLIGNPERKQEFSINIPDGYNNEIIPINVISKDYPKSNYNLTKIKENEYIGKIKITNNGIHDILQTKVAVNYPKEYQKLGLIKNADKLIKISNGKLFNPTDIENMIKHIKSISKRTRITKTYITWPFILLIVIIYLFEIAFRKILENKKTL